MSSSDNQSLIPDSGLSTKELVFYFEFGPYYQIYHPLAILSSSTGLLTNVINVTILTRPAMRNPLNFLLTALAISDILFVLARSCWSIVYFLQPTWIDYANIDAWMTVSGFYSMESCALDLSEWLNVTIGAWRLMAVKWPLRAKHLCSMRRAKIVVTIIVVCCIVINLPYVFLLTAETYDSNGTSVKVAVPKPIDNSLLVVHSYIGVLGVVTVLPLLLAIGITYELVRKMYQAFKNHQTLCVTNSEDKIGERSRTTMMLTIVLVVFILTNTPSTLMFVANYVPIVSMLRFRNIFSLLQSTDKTCTFFIYFVMSSKFRRTCRHPFQYEKSRNDS